MAHIHEKIDFTVSIFVVHESKILVIHHRNLNKWLPLGGHIELDEEPEIAALREAGDEAAAVGIALTVDVVRQILQIPGISGVHLMGMGDDASVRKVVNGAGLFPRPVR
jgi:hypothetical protein